LFLELGNQPHAIIVAINVQVAHQFVVQTNAAGWNYSNPAKELKHDVPRLVDGAPPTMKSYLPNESRLSCGRNARRGKAAEPQIKGLAGEATQFFPHKRPPASSAC